MQRIFSTRLYAVLAPILPVLALVGWITEHSALKSVVPGLTPMNPLTALCFIGLAIASATHNRLGTWRKVSFSFATLVLVSSIWVIAAWMYSIEFRPDAWLFADKLRLEAKLNRMAPNTAAAFVLVAISQLVLIRKSVIFTLISQGLAFCAGLIGAITLFGYILSIGVLGTVGNTLPMAVSTGIGFLLLCCAVFSLRPADGFATPFSGDMASAKMARELLITGFIVPIAVTTVLLYGERLKIVSHEVGSASAALITVLAFALILWRTTSALRTSELARDEMNEGLKSRALELEIARKEADRANQSKSEFLSRMSHELRTPPNAVIGYAQLLEMKSQEPHILKSTHAILKGGRHLLELINEVLDLAKIEAGKLTLSLEPVPLTGTIHQAIELVLPTAGQRGVIIDASRLPTEEIHILADRQRLIQVLLNLLSNSAKFNRPDGIVAITCDETELSYRVNICDTGHGIPTDQVDLLFTPFERLGDTSIEGTGLGLALSQNLMGLMGGSISLTKTSSDGSIFSIELQKAISPALVMSALSEPESNPSRAKHKKIRVVCLEDNLSNLQLLENVFHHYGEAELMPAMHASVGMELIRDHIPDLVLLDLHLPGVHGLEVLKQLKSDPLTAEIPVVILSADATAGQISRSILAGAKNYLTKPIDIPLLLAELDEIRNKSKEAA